MSLLGLRGRADDWASSLPDSDKDTFAKSKENMTKIFGDKRAQWQKHTDFSSLKQTKEQSVIDFAGVLKQRQAKSEANPAMMLAVFLDRLKSAIGRQVAILDPKTFEEPAASATQLETLDRSKTGSKITGAVAELVQEEIKELAPMNELLDRFGVVLARLENLPPPPQAQTATGNKNIPQAKGRPTQFYQNKNYQARPSGPNQAPAAGGRDIKVRD